MKKLMVLVAMLLIPTVPALAQVPEEPPQTPTVRYDIQYDNEPDVCLLGQADMVCPEGSIVVQYAPDGRVYDAHGNEYKYDCFWPDSAPSHVVCEWYRIPPPEEWVGMPA